VSRRGQIEAIVLIPFLLAVIAIDSVAVGDLAEDLRGFRDGVDDFERVANYTYWRDPATGNLYPQGLS